MKLMITEMFKHIELVQRISNYTNQTQNVKSEFSDTIGRHLFSGY